MFVECVVQLEMRHSLKDLDAQIEAGQAEVAALEERGAALALRLQEEERRHGEAVEGARREREALSRESGALEGELAERQGLLAEKGQLLEALEAGAERARAAQREAQARLEAVERELADKCGELEGAERLCAKYADSLEAMRGDEGEMVKGLEKVGFVLVRNEGA